MLPLFFSLLLREADREGLGLSVRPGLRMDLEEIFMEDEEERREVKQMKSSVLLLLLVVVVVETVR